MDQKYALRCLLFYCISISTTLQCDTIVHKFSFRSRRNTTGFWIGQVELDHTDVHKEAGPWDLEVQHVSKECEDDKTVHVTATITAPPPKRADYEFVPHLGYYKMHIKPKNWHEARDVCYQEGGHMVIINSENEAAIVRNEWRKHPKLFDDWRNSYAHVGITDQIKEGDFITIFGEKLNTTGYTKWLPNEPGEGKIGNCGCVTREALLADTGCNNALAFFCEIPLW